MIRGICEDVLKRVYDFSDMTNEELRCKFFQKLQECIELCNSTSDILEWLKNEGLENEVNELLTKWKEDGTLDTIINKKIFTELKTELLNKVNENTERVEAIENNVNTTVNNAIDNIEDKFNILKNEVNEKLKTILYVKNEDELLQAVETAKTNPTIIYIYKDIKLTNTIFMKKQLL